MAEEPAWLAEQRSEAMQHISDGEWGYDDEPVIRRQTTATTNGHKPPPDPDYESPFDQIQSKLLRGGQILEVPPPEPLIDGWLNLDSFSVLYGRPKSGKSFVALDMACCIASGAWWHRHKVHQGPVLYVIAEGVRGVGRRVNAWSIHNNVKVPDNLVWLPRAVPLLNHQWVDAVTRTAADLKAVFVVFDTLNRCMAGGDENKSQDMGMVIAAADRVRLATGACVQLVHHSGKDAGQGARGHSSLLGAVDTELELKTAENIMRLSNSAQKDSAEALPMRFSLVPVDDSVAVGSYSGRLEDDTTLSANGRLALEALASIQVPGGIATGVWRAAVDMADRTFYDQRRRLLTLGLVVNVGTEKQPRYMAIDPTLSGGEAA